MGNRLQVDIGRGVVLQNPIITASGTFGYGTEVPDLVDVNDLGGIVTKSLTFEPREGHPPPRIQETPSGLLNAIGLANVGVEAFCRDTLPTLSMMQTKIFVSIAGGSQDEYVSIMTVIEKQRLQIAGYEINISCPNVDEGGMEFGVNAEITESLTRRLRELTDRYLMVKLSPNVTNIGTIARAAERGGADGVSAINTVVGMDIDPMTGETMLSNGMGGLSGPAIRPIALANVYKVAKAVDIPVIGLGGITSAYDILRFIRAGATAIQVGTANYRDPAIGVQMADELADILPDTGAENLADLRGVRA